MVTVKRGKNKNYLIIDGTKEIGEAWKIPGKSLFGVKFHGVYWIKGEPNKKGGCSSTYVRRLKDVTSIAELVSGLLRQ
jgi:hypothetical protein